MSQTADPFDELTALFLTGAPGGAPRAAGGAPMHGSSTAAVGRIVELLLVGHLPVRAGLWLGPYVDAIGRERGPTALVRLDLEEPSVEVMRGPGGESGQPAATLLDHVQAISPIVATWVIRPGPSENPADLITGGADRLTILSGADEAAIVGAYRLIKDLADAAQRTGQRLPPIGLALLGCQRQTALQAVERMNRTASTFLGFDLTLVACLPQMDSAVRSTSYQRFDPKERPTCRQTIQWIAQSPTPTSAPPKAPRAAPVPSPSPPMPEVESASEMPAPAPPLVRPAPRVSLNLEPKAPAAALEPDAGGAPRALASYIDGLTPLAARCPGHESVELAVDANGRLHVIAWEKSLRELHVVQAWTKSHRELLAMACREQWIDPAAAVVRHVFTDQPASVADLHGCDLHLHLLAQVRVGEQTGWYASPLNHAAE
jgi:hypothetical protein